MHNSFNIKYIIISFIKNIQKDGSKELCELIFKNMLSILKKKVKRKPLAFFKETVDKSRPFCEIKSVRISGTNYKVPIEINPLRQKVLALKWIVSNSSKKINICLTDSLVNEFVDTYHLSSATIKMRDDLHKIAESNRIYTQSR